jgi:hypothetical protein
MRLFAFLLALLASSAAAAAQPAGRLAIATAVGQAASPTWTADITGQVLSYVPVTGNTLPVVDGSGTIQQVQFTTSMTDTVGSQLNLAGSSNFPAGAAFDVYWSFGNGLCATAWTSGVPSIADAMYGGIKVNGTSIASCKTGAATAVMCPQYQCTYLGSILMDAATPGQLSCTVTYGQSRHCNVWNAYNQIPVMMQAGNPNVNIWSPNYEPSFGPVLHDAANSILAFTGRPTLVKTAYHQGAWMQTFAGHSAQVFIGIGWNSTTAYSGNLSAGDFEGFTAGGYIAGEWDLHANYHVQGAQGANTVTALLMTQSVNGSPVNSGSSAIYVGAGPVNMWFTAEWVN